MLRHYFTEKPSAVEATAPHLVVQNVRGVMQSLFPPAIIGSGAARLCTEALCGDRLTNLMRGPVVVVSKSGTSAQTLLEAQILFETNRGVRTIFITNPDSPLGRLGRKHKSKIVRYPDVPGRFSTFTAPALIPAALAGMNTARLCAAAKRTLDNPEAARLGAGWQLAHPGKNAVLWFFAPRMEGMGQYWRQLIAESLGKDGAGITPIVSIGAQDTHSHLQLYLDGPDDKTYTIVKCIDLERNPRVTKTTNEFSWFEGVSASGLSSMICDATVKALIDAGRPVRVIEIPGISESSIGALAMHFMLETCYLAVGLGVNPFDQPVLENMKRDVRSLLRGDTVEMPEFGFSIGGK